MAPSHGTFFIAFLVLICSVPNLQADAPSPVKFSTQTLRPFLETHCIDCHNAKTKKGGLDLKHLSTDPTPPAVFRSWVKVYDKIRAGEMPPPKRERPPQADSDTVLRGLQAELTAVDLRRKGGQGRAVFRRLNRTEYENTLRDLFDLPVLNVRDMLPEDGRVEGYDKVGTALELSRVQLAKYMEAADYVLDQAIAPYLDRPEVLKQRLYPGGQNSFQDQFIRALAIPLKNMKYDDDLFPVLRGEYLPKKALTQKKFNPYTGSVGFFRHEGIGGGYDFRSFSALFPGRYRVRISLWSFQWDKGQVKPARGDEVVQLAVRGPDPNRGESIRTIGYFDAPSLKPTVYEREVWLNRGESFKVNFASQWPLAAIDLWLTKYVGPGAAIDWLDVEGPIHSHWPPPSHQRLCGRLPLVPLPDIKTEPRPLKRTPPLQIFDISHNQPGKYVFATVVPTARPLTDAEILLRDFLRRAFRRPVSAEEVARYVGLVQKQLNANRYFEEAMRAACKAALCSPDFLFLKETPGQLDDWALAARLSYFLWNSLPDDTLFSLAEKGRLHDHSVLHEQVERMLRDPKSERFVHDFLDQWLDLRDIDATDPDPRIYPEFNPYLRDSMLEESRAFFRELLQKDLPVANLVQSDFLMLNQRLAEHYGIAGVRGAAFRRVPLPSRCRRGGFLTQASVLKVTANGTTTSPVKRGAWVQRKLVGRPPEPPPPDIPALEPDTRGAVTIRDQLAKHRSQAICASCHAKIDLPGFALESFDVIGSWRERYRFLPPGSPRHARYRLGLPVDPRNETAQGRSFRNVDEFKKILLEDPRSIARNLVGHLVIYATGAAPTFADRPVMEQIADQANAPNCSVRSLLHEIIQSSLFQRK